MAERSPADPPPFDVWDPPESRLEAMAFALFAVRRALTQSLVVLPAPLLWRRAGPEASPGEIARAAWQREFHWLWPCDLAAPDLPAQPTLVEVLYGLVRHRAVTEELLMAATDADLSRPHHSRATVDADRDLGSVLSLVTREEFGDLERMERVRSRLQPEWPGIGEHMERATRAVAEALAPR